MSSLEVVEEVVHLMPTVLVEVVEVQDNS